MVEQKAKLQEQLIDVLLLKEQKMVEQQKVEITTFRADASSGKRNERQYEKVHELMKKKR